jgi:hypothetical protein
VAAIKVFFGGYFSLMVFGFAQVNIDIEPMDLKALALRLPYINKQKKLCPENQIRH